MQRINTDRKTREYPLHPTESVVFPLNTPF